MMMLMPRRVSVFGLLVWTLLAAVPDAQDLSSTGPAVGSRLPAFSAVDQFGRMQTLQTLAGSQGVMLVFFRSADW
jgi:hypothetical protein